MVLNIRNLLPKGSDNTMQLSRAISAVCWVLQAGTAKATLLATILSTSFWSFKYSLRYAELRGIRCHNYNPIKNKASAQTYSAQRRWEAFLGKEATELG